MPKPKAVMIEANPGLDKKLQDDARAQRDRLQRAVNDAIDDNRWWSATLADRRMQEVVKSLEERVETGKEELTSCEPKNVPALQARISAARSLLIELKGKRDDSRVQETKAVLRKYEEENALFLAEPNEPARPQEVVASS